jgi:hypothetical protein
MLMFLSHTALSQRSQSIINDWFRTINFVWCSLRIATSRERPRTSKEINSLPLSHIRAHNVDLPSRSTSPMAGYAFMLHFFRHSPWLLETPRIVAAGKGGAGLQPSESQSYTICLGSDPAGDKFGSFLRVSASLLLIRSLTACFKCAVWGHRPHVPPACMQKTITVR